MKRVIVGILLGCAVVQTAYGQETLEQRIEDMERRMRDSENAADTAAIHNLFERERSREPSIDFSLPSYQPNIPPPITYEFDLPKVSVPDWRNPNYYPSEEYPE